MQKLITSQLNQHYLIGPTDTGTSHLLISLVIVISPGYNCILVSVIVISIIDLNFSFSYSLITESKYGLLKGVLVLVIVN